MTRDEIQALLCQTVLEHIQKGNSMQSSILKPVKSAPNVQQFRPEDMLPEGKTRKDFDSDEAYIDHLKAQIDPTKAVSIIEFGGEASKKLADIAQNLRKSTPQDNSIIQQVANLPKMLKNADIDSLKTLTSNLKLAREQGKHKMRRLFNTVRGFTENGERKKLERVMSNSIQDIDVVKAELEALSKSIPRQVERIQELMEAVEVNYTETQYYKAAIEAVESALSDDISKGPLGLVIRQRIAGFSNAQAVKASCSGQLEAQFAVYTLALAKVKDHQTHSIPLWEMQGVAANSLIHTSTAIGSIEHADQLGRDLLDSSTAMTEMSLQDASAAALRTSHDPEKVIEVIVKTRALLESHAGEMHTASQQLIDAAKKIDTALENATSSSPAIKPPSV